MYNNKFKVELVIIFKDIQFNHGSGYSNYEITLLKTFQQNVDFI